MARTQIPTPLTDAMPRWNNSPAIPVDYVKDLEIQLVQAKQTINILNKQLKLAQENVSVADAVVKDLW